MPQYYYLKWLYVRMYNLNSVAPQYVPNKLESKDSWSFQVHLQRHDGSNVEGRVLGILICCPDVLGFLFLVLHVMIQEYGWARKEQRQPLISGMYFKMRLFDIPHSKRIGKRISYRLDSLLVLQPMSNARSHKLELFFLTQNFQTSCSRIVDGLKIKKCRERD